MKVHVFGKLPRAALLALLVAAVGIAAVGICAPRPVRRTVRRRARLRPKAAKRPWRTAPLKRPKVLRTVPRLRTITAPSGVTVVTTPAGTTTDPGGGPVKTVEPVDTNSKFASETAYAVQSIEDDGFTVTLKVGDGETKVRMIGIAPMQLPARTRAGAEGRPGRPARGAPPATAMFLKNLLKGESVYVVYDSQVAEEDEDKNYVGYLYRSPDGLLINLEAVRQGFCLTDTGYDFEEKATFLYYQRKAQQTGKGIWGMRRRQGRRDRPPLGERPRRPGPAS